jgi:hypothetical protein
MRNTIWRRGLALAGFMAVGAATAGAESPVDHQDATLILGSDVYVVVSGHLQNPTGSTPLEEPLFNVAGTPLGVTFGQWRQAGATSRVHCKNNGRTDVRLRLGGLVAGGVYSVFYATFAPDSRNPLCPAQERLLALPSKDPEQAPDFASFVADANGEADFQGRVEGCLLDPGRLSIVLVYHFDGLTYGELPNRGEFITQGPDCRASWGADAMQHLLIVQKTEG